MEESMNFEVFCQSIKRAVEKRFSETFQIELHQVTKNNGQVLKSLVIVSQERNISPNFYLEEYYKQYESGATIKSIANQIRNVYFQVIGEEWQDIDLSYESCKDKIIYRLVSFELNKGITDEIPHIPFLDLMITFHCYLRQDERGMASIRITNALLATWGISTEILFKLAQKNTRKLFPVRICSMKEMLKGMLAKKGVEDPSLEWKESENDFLEHPYVVTNEEGINGAAVILYPDTLKQIAEIFQSDFYLLPSSIHEMLAVSASGRIAEKELQNMVCTVNRDCVMQEELLSNQVYHYSIEENKVRICS